MYADVPLPVSEDTKKQAEAYKVKGETTLYPTYAHACNVDDLYHIFVSLSGNTHLKLEKFQEAIDCYTNAIKLDAKNATYFCNRYIIHVYLYPPCLSLGNVP